MHSPVDSIIHLLNNWGLNWKKWLVTYEVYFTLLGGFHSSEPHICFWLCLFSGTNGIEITYECLAPGKISTQERWKFFFKCMVWNHEQNILCLTKEVLYMRKRMKENLFSMGSKILQAKQVKCTPQDSINELIIWKINLLVVPVTNVKFKSELLHAKWAVNNLRELVCIWSDWKSLNELKFLEDIYIKFRETKLVEIS